jgi:non-canonical poly(A) RNA polymerase PAPD5/7
MIEGASKFKDINDLFVSDDESGSESAMDLETPDKEENGEPAAKRAKVTKKEAPAPEPEKPKWSNPDPYYLIPPLDESRAKRKDVVQLLRKAKVEAQNTAPAANAVSRNADFIGFGDDDDDEERDDAPAELMVNGGDPSEEGEIGSDEEMEGSRDQGAQRPASLTNGESSRHVQNSFTPINNSSAGPSFSHLRNLHSMEEPQTNGTSLTTTQVQTPVEAPAPSEQALNEARELLAEMNAKEGIEPQNSKRHDRFDRRKPHTDRKRNANEGEITKMWTARDRKSSTPWYIDHSESPNTVYW